MSNSIEDLSIVGFCMLASFVKACVEKSDRKYVQGGMFWATHKSDPHFKDETEEVPYGTGKFSNEGNWFAGFMNSEVVSQAVDLKESCLLTCFVDGQTRTVILTIDEIFRVCDALPKGAITTTVVAVNSKGSRDLSN